MMNSPAEVAENYIGIGIKKCKVKTVKGIVLGIFAGMFIAIAGIGCTLAGATVDNGSIGKLLGALIFPGGLAMVLVSGSELFTGNNLIIISVLEKKVKPTAMLRNWILVYLGNFIGGLLVALLVVYGHTGNLFGGAAAEAIVKTASAKVSMTFIEAMIRGIMCNFLVCIAVWMSFAAKDVAGKILGLFFPIMFFILCGFEHCVANMYYIPAGILASMEYGIAAEGLTWGAFFLKNLLPVTLGNIIGGAGIVGCGYWFIYLKDKNP